MTRFLLGLCFSTGLRARETKAVAEQEVYHCTGAKTEATSIRSIQPGAWQSTPRMDAASIEYRLVASALCSAASIVVGIRNRC